MLDYCKIKKSPIFCFIFKECIASRLQWLPRYKSHDYWISSFCNSSLVSLEFFVFISIVISCCFQRKKTGPQPGGLSPPRENNAIVTCGSKGCIQRGRPARLNKLITCSFSSQLNRILKTDRVWILKFKRFRIRISSSWIRIGSGSFYMCIRPPLAHMGLLL